MSLLSTRLRQVAVSRLSSPARRVVRNATGGDVHRGGVVLRCLNSTSSSDSFSNLEYPLRTQAPVVTRTTAAEAAAAAAQASSSYSPFAGLFQKESDRASPRTVVVDPTTINDDSVSEEDSVDHFDDANVFSEEERLSLLQEQKRQFPTTLQHRGSTPVTPVVPPHIPPNVSASLLEPPQTVVTTLSNGVRVVSQETYGQVCTVGVFFDAGSRHETTVGTAHLLELMAFQSTSQYPSALDIRQALQRWGATSFCNVSKEQTFHCIDVLRPNAHHALQLFQQVLLEPQFTGEEVQDCLRAMEFQAKDFPPELSMAEALQVAAYGPDQQLGRLHWCPVAELANLNNDVLRDFWQRNLISNPQGMVVAAAGIDHQELVDMVQLHFGHLQQQDSSVASTPRTIPSVYRGGQSFVRQPIPAENATPSIHNDGLTRLTVAFELGGWHSDDLIPACVLQTLLGGGNSFSAGGPGKGMYSRLYRQILNRYMWAESAEAYTSLASESGLFGLSGSSQPSKSRDMMVVLIEHMAKLANSLVTDEELSRARNMLKCNVLTQLESRFVLMEDMGRQVLTYGHRKDTALLCQQIDQVTAKDLQQLAQKALTKTPSVVAVGRDLSLVPSQDEVARWL